MIRSLALIIALLCLVAPSYAVEDRGKEPPAPETPEIERGEAPEKEAPSHRITLNPRYGSLDPLREEINDEGVIELDLQGRYQHALVLKIAPDGSRTVECVDAAEHEEELVKSVLPSSETEDDEEN